MNIENLKPLEKNPFKSKGDKQIKLIAKSIESFEKMMTIRKIVIDENFEILGGNKRYFACRMLGMKEIPDAWIDQRTDLTEAEKKEFIVKDNSHWGSEWDNDLLKAWDVPVVDWGVEAYDWQDEKPDAKEDDYEIPDEIQTDIVLGDLFEIGVHRLLCGDSTDSDAVAKLMNGENAVLCNTDPPYGINFVELSKSKGQSKKYGDIENDDFKDEEFQHFLEKCIKASLPHLIKNTAFYFWHPMLTQGYFAAAAAAAAADIIISRQIIWVKPSLVFGRGDYHWKHELCFYGWIKGNKPVFYGERNQTTIWEAGRENDKIHPTQKPVKLFEIPILNHTKEKEVLYEPFSGSGSQMVAAHQLNRRCFGMELDPKYCQVIVDRMKKLDPTLVIKKNGVAI